MCRALRTPFSAAPSAHAECDGAISNAKRSRHVGIKYHYTRDQPSADQPANLRTNNLDVVLLQNVSEDPAWYVMVVTGLGENYQS